jgi:cell division protein ZapE
LSQDKNNETRRFITLIDVLYEYNVVLLCSAQVAIEELYFEDDIQLNFQRTRSRLIEMQSADYPHSL